jgi:L-threonylcarbamoyladenylate synthase
VTVQLLATAGDRPDPGVVAEAATALRRGEVVGIPTDTVYGLAVDPSRAGAVDRLFAVKERPRDVVLPVLVGSVDQALALAGPPGPEAAALMAAWWPGPLTIVLTRRSGVELDLGGDGATIGVRCPAHAVARALAESVGPIATSSANLHGAPPATRAEALVAGLAGVALVVDAGPCEGRPSTVVDCTGGVTRLLRAGPISWPQITATLAGGDGHRT